MSTAAVVSPVFSGHSVRDLASPLAVLLNRQAGALPFDDTVCTGIRGARSRSAAYALHQTLEFAAMLGRAPFSRATYERFAEPWGLSTLIEGGVYRSAEPRAMHLPYLATLGIRTLVCVKRTLPSERTLQHAVEHGLNVARIDLGADGHISPWAVQRAVDVLSQKELWPVLLHCDGGRHRTGIVAAALRRTQGHTLAQAIEEYELHSAPRPRVADGAAIARYFAHCERLEARS